MTNEEFLSLSPSQLIHLALADLEKCEASPKFGIDMGDWVYGDPDEKCFVCLAGAVMCQSLGAIERMENSLSDRYSPRLYERSVSTRLETLNAFRKGYVHQGLYYMGIFSDKIGRYHDVVYYDKNPAKFKQSMREIADMLEAAGL